MTKMLELDQELVDEIVESGNAQSEQLAVEEALRQQLAIRRQASMLSMQGKISFFEDYDYKGMR